MEFTNGIDLHSTMYLLNQDKNNNVNIPSGFTFHYVSIKSFHKCESA